MASKEKKERTLGEHLHVKGERCASPKCALIRRPYPPGVHGQRRTRRGLSDFGRQIREKQKFKVSYGLDERNLRRLFEEAQRMSGSIATRLMELLERRLDNVVFRLGFAPSRSAARKLIVQGHITVNAKRTSAPGYEVRAGDIVGVRAESAAKGPFRELRETLKKYAPPVWLELNLEKLEGRVKSHPEDTTPPFEVNLLVESFSK